MTGIRIAALMFLAACASPRGGENPYDWYDGGHGLDVEEPIEFTDVNYDFPTDPDAGVGGLLDDVFPVHWSNVAAFGPDEALPSGDCEYDVDNNLPWELEAVVTLRPRYYFKTQGCDGDEKYYGSFFVQDGSGGVFVLGDSKVAHFDIGDKVRMQVRGAKTSYDLDMVYAHDIVEVEHDAAAVYYQEADGPLGFADVGEVRRVTGTVLTEQDTFGEFLIEDDSGVEHVITLDSEISRRGLAFDIGERIQVTGPILYSYSNFIVVVMRVGQVHGPRLTSPEDRLLRPPPPPLPPHPG